MVANDTPSGARDGRPARRSGRLYVFQLPEIWERDSVRIYGGPSAFRARRGPDCKGDRRLPCQPRAKHLCVRSAANSCARARTPRLPPMATGDRGSPVGGDGASIDDFVQQDLGRRFIVRTQVHAGGDRVADAADAACLRDGRRSRIAASGDRGSRSGVPGIRGATNRRRRVRYRQRVGSYRRRNRGQQRMGLCSERLADCLRS